MFLTAIQGVRSREPVLPDVPTRPQVPRVLGRRLGLRVTSELRRQGLVRVLMALPLRSQAGRQRVLRP